MKASDKKAQRGNDKEGKHSSIKKEERDVGLRQFLPVGLKKVTSTNTIGYARMVEIRERCCNE